MQERFPTVCFTQEVRRDDFVVVPRGLKISLPSITGNVTSTRYDLYVYKQLGGGIVGINCMIYAMIITFETVRALQMTNWGPALGNTVSL